MTDFPKNPGVPGNDDESRDDQLAARLNADQVPNHGPTFWSDLQASLDAEASATAVRNNGAATPTVVAQSPTEQPSVLFPEEDQTQPILEQAPVSDEPTVHQDMGNVISLSERPRRSRVPMVLTAAAAVLVMAVAAAALIARMDDATSVETADENIVADGDDEDDAGEDGDGSAPAVSDADEAPDDASSETDEDAAPGDPTAVHAADYNPVATTTIGTGRLVGFTPDQSGVLVLDDSPSGALGCEGAVVLELFVQNLATGARTGALPAGTTIETGGLDFRFGDPAGGAGPVTFVEYCDGFAGGGWSGTIASDGTIGDIQSIEVDESGRPVGAEYDPTGIDSAAKAFTPDESAAVYSEEGRVWVEALDGSESWNAPEEMVAFDATFDPSGQVVVAINGDQLFVWNYRLGEVVEHPFNGGFSPVFNQAGTQLAVERFADDGFLYIDVVTFNDGTPPTPTAPTTPAVSDCSGDTGLAPLTAASLEAAGVPAAVAQTVAAVDEAAANCDWSVLASITSADFTASFGGIEAIELWTDGENNGTGYMGPLRQVLRQPFAVLEGDGDIYNWPAVFASSCDSLTDEDQQSLADLGYTDEDLAEDCAFLGSYAGFRAGFDASGNWLYFVAGD